MRQPTGRAPRLVAPLALIAIGVVCWAFARSSTFTSAHSYSAAGTPSATVHLTRGHTYSLAVPGGITALHRLGVNAATATCTATGSNGFPGRLTLHAEAADTKAVNEFASFVAATTGQVTVACTSPAGAKDAVACYVDNADDAAADRSGYLLLIAVAALVLGLPLLLSALRVGGRERVPTGTG